MTELGEALELLHDSDRLWRTIRVRGTEWRDQALLGRAFDRELPVVSDGFSGHGVSRSVRASMRVGFAASGAGGDDGEESTETWAYWQEADRKRAEFAVGDEMVAVVYEGDTYWSLSPSRGATTNAGRQDESHGLGPAPALIDTAPLVSLLRFRATGEGRLLGRPVLELAAEPRPSRGFMSGMVLQGIGQGADEYRLSVDRERGVLLRCEAQLEGRAFRVLEMTDVAFDEELPVGTFVIELPAGDEFDGTREHESTTLQELPGPVPFRVFVPDRHLGRPHVHIMRRRNEGRRVTSVVISYSPDDRDPVRPLWINETAHADSDFEPDEGWRSQGSLSVWEQAEDGYVRSKVRLTRDGTDIHLESTGASLEELIRLAESLKEIRAGES